MCKYHDARGRKYELLACVSIIQHEDARTSCWHVSTSYSARDACANEYRKYELLSCVSIIQREGCMRADEYQ